MSNGDSLFKVPNLFSVCFKNTPEVVRLRISKKTDIYLIYIIDNLLNKHWLIPLNIYVYK